MNSFKSFIIKYKSLVVLIILVAVLSIAMPRFLTVSNILNVLTQISINAIIAIGMCIVILSGSGGIDLSVGSVVAITGAVAASLYKSGINLPVCILCALGVGALIGFTNGILTAKQKIQPFIATLCTQIIFRGITYVYTDGKPISGLDDSFTAIGNNRVLGIPIPVLITLIIFLIALYVLNETVLGRHIYANGGNEECTRFSGVNTDRLKILVYIISGLTAAISGIIVTARIGSASPNAGLGYETDAIAAVVLGGTRMSGGEGTMFGTIIGAVIIGVINNGLNLMNVNPFYQSIVKGVIILLAVFLDKKNKE